MDGIQLDLLGQLVFTNDFDRARYILQQHPGARNSYRRAMYEFWLEFDGLADVLGEQLNDFKTWFCSRKVTAPKTIQNRASELINNKSRLRGTELVDNIQRILDSDLSLQEDPKNYRRIQVLYWIRHDGLGEILKESTDSFIEWFVFSATPPKTIQIQVGRVQDKHPELEALDSVEEWRQKQAHAGPAV